MQATVVAASTTTVYAYKGNTRIQMPKLSKMVRGNFFLQGADLSDEDKVIERIEKYQEIAQDNYSAGLILRLLSHTSGATECLEYFPWKISMASTDEDSLSYYGLAVAQVLEAFYKRRDQQNLTAEEACFGALCYAAEVIDPESLLNPNNRIKIYSETIHSAVRSMDLPELYLWNQRSLDFFRGNANGILPIRRKAGKYVNFEISNGELVSHTWEQFTSLIETEMIALKMKEIHRKSPICNFYRMFPYGGNGLTIKNKEIVLHNLSYALAVQGWVKWMNLYKTLEDPIAAIHRKIERNCVLSQPE